MLVELQTDRTDNLQSSNLAPRRIPKPDQLIQELTATSLAIGQALAVLDHPVSERGFFEGLGVRVAIARQEVRDDTIQELPPLGEKALGATIEESLIERIAPTDLQVFTQQNDNDSDIRGRYSKTKPRLAPEIVIDEFQPTRFNSGAGDDANLEASKQSRGGLVFQHPEQDQEMDTSLAWDEGGDEGAMPAAYESYSVSGSHPAAERIGEMYQAFRDKIFNSLYRYLGNTSEAEELTNDTFLKAMEALPRMAGELKEGPWLYRIAQNLAMDRLRRRSVVHFQEYDPAVHPQGSSDPEDDPVKALIRSETTGVVRDALGKLPPKYRTVLLLREFQYKSCAEIAQIMGTTRSAVKSLLFRARVELKNVGGVMSLSA